MKKYCLILFMLLCYTSIVYSMVCVKDENELVTKSNFSDGAKLCLNCHFDKKEILNSDMALQRKENKYIKETFHKFDKDFKSKNCSGCHVDSCSSCHTEITKEKKVSKPDTDSCLRCHNDLYTGIEYIGLGIREDHERYQRGKLYNNEYYMKMLPDVHFEKGMTCASCHDMANLSGQKKAKQCTDCHRYSQKVIDHQIKGHEKVACVSCHGAWAPQEYGSFFIQIKDSNAIDYFRWVKKLNDEYIKSSFMRSNNALALGLDKGTYVPIKPKFIVFATKIVNDKSVGDENAMLSNKWSKFTPHTIRKETMLCDSCHENERRYLLEKEEDRYLLPDKDGLPIKSFYNSKYFSINNARFVTEEEYKKINDTKSEEYIKYYFKKLDQIKKVVK